MDPTGSKAQVLGPAPIHVKTLAEIVKYSTIEGKYYISVYNKFMELATGRYFAMHKYKQRKEGFNKLQMAKK